MLVRLDLLLLPPAGLRAPLASICTPDFKRAFAVTRLLLRKPLETEAEAGRGRRCQEKTRSGCLNPPQTCARTRRFQAAS